jgi:hypothetical protein
MPIHKSRHHRIQSKTNRSKHISHHKALLESAMLVGLSFLVAVVFYRLGFFHDIIRSLHGYGYIGVFVAGMFFVSVFTAAPATVVLLLFTETLHILPIAIVAGLGAVVGDGIILSLLSHGIEETLAIFPKETGIARIIVLLRHTKYRLLLTLIGALVVASPLPDELGLALMGVSKVRPATVAAITFVLNTIGIFLLLTVLK